MNETCFDKIRGVVQTHTYINQAVVNDVIKRCRDYLEMSDTREDDNYIKRQYEYLLKWINK